jgi:hypothetical protein
MTYISDDNHVTGTRCCRLAAQSIIHMTGRIMEHFHLTQTIMPYQIYDLEVPRQWRRNFQEAASPVMSLHACSWLDVHSLVERLTCIYLPAGLASIEIITTPVTIPPYLPSSLLYTIYPQLSLENLDFLLPS